MLLCAYVQSKVISNSVFTARRSYASTVLGVVILSVCPTVRLSHACFVTNPKNLPAIFSSVSRDDNGQMDV